VLELDHQQLGRLLHILSYVPDCASSTPIPKMPQAANLFSEYWLPGYNLSRHIVFGTLHYHLGPTATVRPYSWHGREGYLIHGPQLTKEQIDDLVRQSREYERQQSIRMCGRAPAAESAEPDINEPVVVTINRRNNPPYPPQKRYR